MLPTISGAILGGQQYKNCLVYKVGKRAASKEKAKIK